MNGRVISWRLRAALLGGVSWLAAGTALAQTPPPASQASSQDAASLDEVIVTGSRIRRNSIDTPTPIVSVSSQDLAESGDTELSETLAELPAVSSTINDSTVTGNVQNSGLSSINLRNLGDNRTLVLVDGRRTVSNSANGNRVSLSTIPSDFVDRVEVITGGTSSVYGSDAVAGVVNIITETGQTGVKLGGRYGIAQEGDGEEITWNASWGDKFDNDRGYLLISGSYDRDFGIRASDREFATRQVDFDYDEVTGINEFDTLYLSGGVPTSGDQPASSFPPNIFRDLSGFTPGGVFYGASSSRDRFYRGGTLVPLGPDVQTGGVVTVGTTDNGNTGYFLPNRDGYNQREFRSLILPRERTLFAAKADYDLSETLSLFGQIQYSRIDSKETREPNGIGFDDTFQLIDPITGVTTERSYGRIPCRRATGTGSGPCNPFVPDEIRRDVSTGGAGVAWDRRFVELGGQTTENQRETLRSWAGVRGTIWGDWDWEASVGYGEFNQEQIRGGEINSLRLVQALDAVTVGGQIVCRDPSNGCVPVNIFGEGSITPAAADFLRVELRQDAAIKQESFQAFMSGDLFELPAGPMGVAFGVDYRKDSQSLRGDALSQAGGTTGNAVPNFDGGITAYEGFGEVSVPLIRDRPGFELLSLDASARVADYDIKNVGTVFSYRAGLQWAPVDDLRFRAQFARAQRAPDLSELFSPPRGDFDSASDICSGVTPTTAGRIAANCRASPGVQALFAQQLANGLPQRFEQVGSSIYSPNAGNLNLKEETADTITVGAVFRPRFVDGLTLAIDYYDISIEDAITEYSNQDLLIQCYDSDLAVSANPFCADIRRNPNNGQISEVIQRQFNLAGLNTSGIDVAVQYRFDLEDRFGVPGEWDLRYDATHILEQEFVFEGLAGTVVTDQKGDLSAGSFEYRARGSLAWENAGFRLRWTTTYYGETLDSRFRLNQYNQLLQTVPGAEFPLFLEIDSVVEHDLYAGYTFEADGGEMRIYAGVNNVTNEISPFLPTGDVFSGRLTNYNGAYDVAGRRFYLGLTLEF
ncbi:MAG: TonB-dependent receptor [Brevundimonas sp.]|nr:TonB-dependent receptor [Brevundimonas sp.]MDZ4060701.1 TonB-dependent receptor [Brevundimonas sp.]